MPNFRFDRAISIHLGHPLSRLLRSRQGASVPILMYHSIRDEFGGKHPYFETNTSVELFAQHMRFLHENGYATVDLREALQVIMLGRNNSKVVAITFDDGHQDFYTRAFPILAEYGFTATIFVITGLIQDERTCSDENGYMTWREIREIHSCDIRVGSHTVTHPELRWMRPRQLEYELQHSKATIEDKLGEPVFSFSYPYAFPEEDRRFVDLLRALLETYGYENGVSTIIGTASEDHDWFFLPRLPINSYDDLRFFEAKLHGGYDWLHSIQYATKRIRSRV